MKLVLNRLRESNPVTRSFLRGGLMVTCALLFGALILLWHVGAPTLENLYIWELATAMREMGPGILFIVSLGAVFSENYLSFGSKKKK